MLEFGLLLVAKCLRERGTMSSDAIALPAVGESGKPLRARSAAASMLGTILEWYDFSIYNTMAALIFNRR
jgi:hypothetical protein